MKARFIVAIIVALSFFGGSIFAAQANNKSMKNDNGKAKTTQVAHAKKHHAKRMKRHAAKKTSVIKKSKAPDKSKAMK